MSENAGTKQQKENLLPKEQLEVAKKWLQLVAQARADKTLKQRLMETPNVVLREHGINVRQGLEMRVVEDTDKVVYLKLPAVSELSEKQLDGVVGGYIVHQGGDGPDLVADQTGLGDVLLTLGGAVVSTITSVINALPK